ncbi:hypothetical protein AVDCRST_MAG94-4668 [uncultured Leptolyngbya sp.]|uniref:Uncharacterized protein n=1 Tax=uncultured Leptolyngbya sp. TaxID=332963 RepID=A0A6J4N6V8_9CYAN|nr:hypothetical protein AVDCRST_MAG94-4668 [uncultured Leptolyngbya sp.]
MPLQPEPLLRPPVPRSGRAIIPLFFRCNWHKARVGIEVSGNEYDS